MKPNSRIYLGYFNVTTYMFVQRPSNSQAELQVSLQSHFQKSEILPECFKCPNLPGLSLDNNGGGGSVNSHWEKMFNPLEYMNVQVKYPAIISDFTMDLLRDSGWYITRIGAVQ